MKSISIFFFIALLVAVAAVAHAGEHPALKVESIKLNSGKDAQIGGIDLLPNGKIAVAFHDGEVRLYDPKTREWTLFASGLHEPLGLVAEDNHTVVVMQRPELTKISDTDQDGVADTYETICDDFGMSGNYHEFAFGPVKDDEGNYFVSLNAASNGAPIREEIRGDWLDLGLPRDQFYVSKEVWKAGVKKKAGRMYSRVPYRGWVLKIDGETGEMTPWASGFRSPNGLGFDAGGKLYVSDNQGDWVGTSKLYHVEKGNFYGHPASLPWTAGYDGPATVDLSPEVLDTQRTRAAVWFTQGTMANSPTQPILIPEGFGPFGGQMLIGEMNKSRIIRLMLEEVNGVTQGACTPLIDGHGLDMGINRFAFDADHGLILGNSHLSWPGGEGMARISFQGGQPYQAIKDITITEDGFKVEFLEEITDPSSLDEVTLSRYTFDYYASYGSPQQERAVVELEFSPIGNSGKEFRATLTEPHKRDFCYEFQFPMAYEPLLCYTARQIPGSPAEPASLSTTQARSEPAASPSSDPNDNYGWVNLLENDGLDLWRNGSKSSRNKIATVGELWSIEDGVLTLDKNREGRGGHIITKQDDYFNFELKFDFLISVEGNSGVKYRVNEQTVGLEYQILDDGRSKVSKNSVASLYNLKAAAPDKAVNEPGKAWNQGRIVAVGNSLQHWLNGELVVEIEFGSDEWEETFQKSKYKEDPAFARAPGPILLQDHGDDVKYRNLMIRKIMDGE